VRRTIGSAHPVTIASEMLAIGRLMLTIGDNLDQGAAYTFQRKPGWGKCLGAGASTGRLGRRG